MNRLMLKHLFRVLWLWLLLVEVLGGDDLTSELEKQLVVKQESRSESDSLVHSSVTTKVSKYFTNTSSFDDERKTHKTPDDIQSTISLSNDTEHLSKNTVPVLKYPGPTESSIKEKYRRTTLTTMAITTPFKKNPKLKRNMTHSRTSDLTTLLVYNALTPGRYPSTTQVAESMPPTAWALASLKGPGPPQPNIKPFVSWSTRLSRPTTPPPITEVTDIVTELQTANHTELSGFITTAPGNEETDTTTVLIQESTSSLPEAQVTTLSNPTEMPADVTALKPEENTISVPPLASLKNTKIDEERDLSTLLKSESSKDVISESSVNKSDTISLEDNVQKNSVTEENKSKISPTLLSSMTAATLNDTNKMSADTSQVIIDNNNGPSVKIINDSLSDQDLDPSINTINEKKHDDQVLTSTVISAVNSSVTIQVSSPDSVSSKNSNITNLIDVDQKPPVDDEFKQNIPQDVEITTLSNTVSQSIVHDIVDQVSISEANQTINDIKVITKNNKITPVVSDFISIETPSTLKSNEIKPEHISTNIIKSSNVTQFPIKSFPNYVKELAETTQSNDIQVQDQIKPFNKTLIQQFIPINSSENQKQSTTKSDPSIITTLYTTTISPPVIASQPSFTVTSSETPSNYTDLNEMAEQINETSTVLDSITTTPSFNTTIIPEIMISLEGSLPSLPTTSVKPSSNFSSTIADVTVNITTTTTTTTVSPSFKTSKSNEIKDQESATEINLQPPEINTTNFDLDSKNSSKNDTSLAFRDGEEEDDESLTYNHTDISYKKGVADTNNNDNDDDGDDVLDTSVNGSVFTTLGNFSYQSTTPLVPVKQLPSLKPSTVTPDDTTHLDEDRTNLDDDTMYDTGVIMTIYVRLIIQASYHELCKNKDLLKDSIVKAFKNYAERTINRRQVVIINLGMNDCTTLHGEMEPRLTPVHIMLINSQGQYDKSLNDLFISLARQKNLDFKYPISQVEKVQQETLLETEPQISGTMVAAIIISSIAAVCLFALIILLVIMRKRQTGFNYGQRCTPVSLDDYSLDNISVYNSVRRKAIRASKRSYGNPAFDDPDTISNPVNFAGLSNMATDKSKTDEEFSFLPQVVVKLDELPPGAEIKNRYANVIPIPETRVQLQAVSPEEQFINANYVKGAKGVEKFYIACQAPLQNTIEDFWRMIWDEQSRLIIMLTALTENGVEKCADYLPPSEVLDCHRVFGDLQVTLKKREAREKYVISSLQLKNLETNLWREVTHMWYAGWPHTGVPPEPSSVIAFLIEARSYSKSSPIIVHCSPGTGRTGTVIAIDIAIRDFEAGRSVDIPKTVVQVRRGRAGAVQTKDQYSFIYKVLHLYATKLTGGGLDSI